MKYLREILVYPAVLAFGIIIGVTQREFLSRKEDFVDFQLIVLGCFVFSVISGFFWAMWQRQGDLWAEGAQHVFFVCSWACVLFFGVWITGIFL